MMKIDDFYKQFCKEEFDKDGILCKFESIVPDGFNFAYDVVDKIAEIEPNRRAMVWCDDNGQERFFTFDDMRRYSNRAANLFLANGIKKGDMVMLVLKRHYQFWFAILGLHKIGAIGVPATNLLTTKDFVYRFQSAGVSHVVCTAQGEVASNIESACKEYSAIQNKFIAKGSRDGWVDFDCELAKQKDSFTRIANSITDTILLYFTSGTTGYPKMVYHNHSYPIAHIITAKYWHNIPADGLHFTVSETGWAKSVWGKLYGQWLAGAAVFVYDMDKFVPKELLARIEKYNVTSFCAPPTIYRYFISEDPTTYNFSSVKYATTAGEALNSEVYNRFYQHTGLRLMEAFGQTETTVMTLNCVGTTPKPGSMGKPSPLYQVELVDSNNNPVSPGEVGEIVMKIPKDKPQNGLFCGYYNDQKQTDKVLYNGYYHTGDTAWRDEDGYMWYVGRTDDIIKSSGYRIGPFEIESVLMEHPSVMECAVTGAPDPERGTVVKATIVLAKNYSPSPELIKEIQTFVKKQTAPYKYPRIIEFVPELPKTISGKIKRAVIRKEMEN